MKPNTEQVLKEMLLTASPTMKDRIRYALEVEGKDPEPQISDLSPTAHLSTVIYDLEHTHEGFNAKYELAICKIVKRQVEALNLRLSYWRLWCVGGWIVVILAFIKVMTR